MYSARYEFPIARMAKVLKVSESGYYKWLKRLFAPPTKREVEDLELAKEIYELFWRYHGIFGARKITSLLNKGRENPVNHKRVERLMGEYGLVSKVRLKYIHTTDSKHDEPVAANLLQRNFSANRPNEKMVSDTTAVATKQGVLYAAAILDLYGRYPVGLALSMKNDARLVEAAFEDMQERGFGATGCILHSDRGSTYCSKAYQEMLAVNGFIPSMSRKGDCWDNAPMESFWGKLKAEWLDVEYESIKKAVHDIREYVYGFYPNVRIHETNGNLTPAEFYMVS